MAAIQIYHNKRCSKSNQALNYLTEKGFDDLEVVFYLDNPISKETVQQIVDLLENDFEELIRKPDAKKMGIEIPKKMTKKWVVNAIVKEPKIMQRPIVVANGKAVIARPTEKIDNLEL